MRKLRDFDSELKLLGDKARLLKERKLHQLGELVIATGADALSVEHLAGLLLSGVETQDAAAKEAWRKRGAVFFQRSPRHAASARSDQSGASAGDGHAQPARS
ncbi:conjugal transfer protein TraD [Sphingomonas sp.]|uniref:conjugal transfer protein TraD n=1 Tax=Sphingomonas sp. TaxID=28214 RepID=UPI003AFFDCA6